LTLQWIFEKYSGKNDAVRAVMDDMENILVVKNVHLAGQAAHDSHMGTIATRGGSLPLEVGGVRMTASPGTFFQVNPDVNSILVERTLAHLHSMGSLSLLDLYCGNGNFSLPAAAAGLKTVGVEFSPGAVLDALAVSGSNNRFIEMDTLRFLALDNEEPDAVIVNPPRTGLPRELVDLLGAKRSPLLIYISCEPSTLARDLARLTTAGYVISDIELFDMFPQTFHSETMVVMKG
jgi:tRNA/tmRNA/rRNA uracil-C5-methylase (TrmA/RlmC/RlmD family)